MKFNLYWCDEETRSQWDSHPSAGSPYDDRARQKTLLHIMTTEQDRINMQVGDTFIDRTGDKWERIE